MLQKNILIFQDGIRPDENFLGLLHSVNHEDHNCSVRVVSFRTARPHRLDSDDFYSDQSIFFSFQWRKIFDFISFKPNWIFGSPSKGYKAFWTKLFLSLVFGRPVFIKLLPGRIQKRTGVYKKNMSSSQLRSIKRRLVAYILNEVHLAVNFEDYLYCLAAYDLGPNDCIWCPPPKYRFIHHKIRIGNTLVRKTGILIAPAQRVGSGDEGLYGLIRNSEWAVDLMKECEIFVSLHEHNTTGDSVSSSFRSFEGCWENIDIVVTDVSSIGGDFLSSGGAEAVYFFDSTDHRYFERVVPSFFSSVQDRPVFSDSQSVVDFLKGRTGLRCHNSVSGSMVDKDIGFFQQLAVALERRGEV